MFRTVIEAVIPTHADMDDKNLKSQTHHSVPTFQTQAGLHVLIALEGQIPAVQHKVVQQHLDDAFAGEQLAAEDVRQDAPVVVQVHRHQLALKGKKEYYFR